MNRSSEVMFPSSLGFCLLSWPWFGPLLDTCPQAVKLQGGQSTQEAAGEPGEKHATLGTGGNENETGENKSISTAHTGLLTPPQHQAYTRGQRTGFTYKSSCINAACARTLPARSVYTTALLGKLQDPQKVHAFL